MSRALVMPRGNTSEIWSQKTSTSSSQGLCVGFIHFFTQSQSTILSSALLPQCLSIDCPFFYSLLLFLFFILVCVAYPCSRSSSLFSFLISVLVLHLCSRSSSLFSFFSSVLFLYPCFLSLSLFSFFSFVLVLYRCSCSLSLSLFFILVLVAFSCSAATVLSFNCPSSRCLSLHD